MIDILTLNYNDAFTTIGFVNSVTRYHCVGRILIVDNCSTDDSLSDLKSIESDKIIVIKSEKNGGYGAGNNLGIRYLCENFGSEYILLANPDVIVDEDTLQNMYLFLKFHEDYAIAAPVMTDLNGIVQYNTAFKIPNIWQFMMSFEMFLSRTFKPFYYKNIDCLPKPFFDVGAVSGSLFMMNASKMMKYGMFDENVFLYCEEHILATKLEYAGLKTALLTNLRFIHNHSVSISKSYNSNVSRDRLLNESRIYVLKHYYKANFIVVFFAKILSKVYLLESLMVDLFKKH
jgi:GT2 family glycosyltransferase